MNTTNVRRVRPVSRPCTHVDFLFRILSSAREDLAFIGRPDPLRTLFSHLQDQAHRLDLGVPARAEPGPLMSVRSRGEPDVHVRSTFVPSWQKTE